MVDPSGLSDADQAIAALVIEQGLLDAAALDGHIRELRAGGGRMSLLAHLVDRGAIPTTAATALKAARAASASARSSPVVGPSAEPLAPPAPPAPPSATRAIAIIAVSALLLVVPSLVFALKPAPDYAVYLEKPASGKYRALLFRFIRYDEAGAIVELGSRDLTRRAPLGRFIGPTEVDNTGAIVPFRLLFEHGAALEERLAVIGRDRKAMGHRTGIPDAEVERLMVTEGGAMLLPWLVAMEDDGLDPTRPGPIPRAVRVRVLAQRLRGVPEWDQPLPTVVELALDD